MKREQIEEKRGKVFLNFPTIFFVFVLLFQLVSVRKTEIFRKLILFVDIFKFIGFFDKVRLKVLEKLRKISEKEKVFLNLRYEKKFEKLEKIWVNSGKVFR